MYLGEESLSESEVFSLLESDRINTYMDITACTILVYDYALTLGREAELFWSTPWSLAKVLFFLTRYSAFLDGIIMPYVHIAPTNISVRSCTIMFRVSGWLTISGVAISELALAFRTWALWERNRAVIIGLLLLWFALAVPIILVTEPNLNHVEFGPSPSPQTTSCWHVRLPESRILFINFIMVVVYESVTLGLAVYKALQHLRRGSSNLVTTLYRDGIQYYIYLMVFSFANMIILLQKVRAPSLILVQRVLHSVFTGRILLNLRGAVKLERKNIVVTGMPTAEEFDETSCTRRTALSTVVIGDNARFSDVEYSH